MKKIFVLSRLIGRALKEAGNASRLAKMIADANGGKSSVGWKLLEKLARDPEHVRLSYPQLEAIDHYLATRPEGGLDRNPLFQKPGILDCLVETPRVAFLLGSTPRQSEQRNDLSRWDSRAMAGLLHEICLRSSALHTGRHGVEFEIEDVLLDFPVRPDKLMDQSWHRWLNDKNCSIISVGSSRACHASEVILAQMFGLRPFVKQSAAEIRSPFTFIWPDTEPGESGRSPAPSRLKGNPRDFQSRFALGADDLPGDQKKLAQLIRAGKACAFHYRDTFYPVVPNQAKPFKMYAVIAAQRRRDSQTHVVIAGLSGPATFAAAELVRDFKTALPHVPGGESSVVYRPVEVVISAKGKRGQPGDIRTIEKYEFMDEPQIWQAPVAKETPRDGK